MPGMSGFDFLAQVRHASPWTPILLISGYAGEHIAKQALEEGAYDFIQKPLDRDAFILAMKRALEAHDLRTSGPNHLVKGSMLCVLGLDPKVNVDDIKKLFLPYGKIAWARLIVNTNGHEVAIGYVEMSSKEDAVGALHALDGHKVFDALSGLAFQRPLLRNRRCSPITARTALNYDPTRSARGKHEAEFLSWFYLALIWLLRRKRA